MLRRASEQSWQRPPVGPSHLILAAGIIGCVAGKASAQTSPPPQPAAAPLTGQVSISSPLSTNAVENRPRFGLVPSLRTAYDSNVLRFVDLNDTPRDNIRVTPGIDLTYRRQIGRLLVSVNGSAGYDFNSRFKFLNQSRVSVNGSAKAPIGSICAFSTDVDYNRATFDINDIQSNDAQSQVGAVSTIQSYSLNASCKRSAGFSPNAELSYQKLSNSQFRFLNIERYQGSGGLSYTAPSIGTLSLNAIYTRLRRPFISDLTGINDDTNIYGVALGLRRAVSPRLQISASGGISKAVPERTGVRRFTGASYNGTLVWLPNSRLTVSGTLARQVSGQNGISATYVIRDDYTLSAGYKVSAKSQFTLAGNRSKRDFRGGNLTPFLEPLRADRLNNLSANYAYDLTPKIRVAFGVSQRWRTADNPVYDYRSTVLTSSIGAHF